MGDIDNQVEESTNKSIVEHLEMVEAREEINLAISNIRTAREGTLKNIQIIGDVIEDVPEEVSKKEHPTNFRITLEAEPQAKYELPYKAMLYDHRRSEEVPLSSFTVHRRGATSNCQMATIANAAALIKLDQESFNLFIEQLSDDTSVKNQILVDVKDYVATKLITLFDHSGDYEQVLHAPYTNKTGTEMAILIYDIRPDLIIDEEGDEVTEEDLDEEEGEYIFRRRG